MDKILILIITILIYIIFTLRFVDLNIKLKVALVMAALFPLLYIRFNLEQIFKNKKINLAYFKKILSIPTAIIIMADCILDYEAKFIAAKELLQEANTKAERAKICEALNKHGFVITQKEAKQSYYKKSNVYENDTFNFITTMKCYYNKVKHLPRSIV